MNPEISLTPFVWNSQFSSQKMIDKSKTCHSFLQSRRTIRDFSSIDVPQEVIQNCILTAGTAPSGANLQPWHFAVVRDPETKKKIRIAAEKEEKHFYKERAPQEWLDALAPLGTDWEKPFLEEAPCLIVIFAQSYRLSPEGKKWKNYYVQESVGIATGLLINAIHHSGLVSLTHTPSPMRFLNKICNRPKNERAYMILVAGFPAENATVPTHAIQRKSLEEICTFI